MKRKTNNLARAAMMLLLAVLGSVGVWAQSSVVTVGSTTYGHSYLPSSPDEKFSTSQQIYTNDEIGQAGQITSIAFYNYDTGSERSYDIYLSYTSKAAFDSETDWVTVAESNKVFSGTVKLTQGVWTVIDFDTPFQYNGTQNLILTVDDNTGKSTGYNYSIGSYSASGHQALFYYKSANLDPTKAITEAGVFHPSYSSSDRKNCIQLCFETYPKPYKFEAIEIGDVSAQLQCSLRGDATAWNLRYRKVGDTDWITFSDLTVRSKTIEELTAHTKYEAQVQAIFPEDHLSDWTESLLFTTNCCPVEQQTELQYSLWGDYSPWYGYAVQIMDITDEDNPVEAAYLCPPSYEQYTGIVTLCCGHTYKVNWIYDGNHSNVNGSFSFSLSLEPGDLVYNMAKGEAPEETAELTTFVVDCGDYCSPMPKNVSVDDIFHDGVLLSFTTNTAGGKIVYSTEADFNPATATNTMNITFDASGHGISDGSSGSAGSYRLTGLEPQTDYYVALQSVCTAQPYDGGGSSRWTKPVKVTTLSEEVPVDNITVIKDGSTKTQVGWAAKGEEKMHNVYIRQQTGAGTAVTSSQIQRFNLEGEGTGFTTWSGPGGGYASTATTSTPDNDLAETSKWLVVTNVPADGVVKVKTGEGNSKKSTGNAKAKTTEVFSVGAEKQTATGDALNDEILTKITDLKNLRKSGKKLTKSQWKEKYRQYKNKKIEWELTESGSAEEKALAKELKSLKRELGLDKSKVRKAANHGISAGFKAYKNAKKSKKANRSAESESDQYFVWINHEEGIDNGCLVVTDLEIVTPENMGEWTAYSDVTGNAFTFEKLTPGTTYEVMIEPVYDDGTTGPEASIMFTTCGEEVDPTPVELAFSVSSDGKKVQFAKSNLHYSGDGMVGEWSLASHAYETLGENNIETYSTGTSYPASHHDLFCWSTSSTMYGDYSYYYYEEDETWPYFHDALADWGTNSELISYIGAGWSTLSKAEWNYLLNERENAASHRAHATVNEVKGLIILPDAWTAPAGVAVTDGGTYTAEQWSTLEESGAIFLPAAGQMYAVYDPDSYGSVTTFTPGAFYWTNSPADESIANAKNYASVLTFDDTQLTISDLSRRTYNAVRLAKSIVMPIKTAASGYTTLVSTEMLDFSNVEGLTAYIATNVNNTESTVTLKRIDVVPANTPVVLKGAPSTTYIVPTTITTAGQTEGNLLRGSATESTELEANTAYILSGGKFHKNNAGTMPAGKAYLPAVAVNITSAASQLTIIFDDGQTTAIKEVSGKKEDVRSNVWYDLSGRKLNGMPSQKGLYIINGKKIVIK